MSSQIATSSAENKAKEEHEYQFEPVYSQKDLDEALKEANLEHSKEIEKLNKAYKLLEEKLIEADEEIMSKESVICDLELEIESYSEIIANREDEIAQLETEVDSLREEVSELILITGKSE